MCLCVAYIVISHICTAYTSSPISFIQLNKQSETFEQMKENLNGVVHCGFIQWLNDTQNRIYFAVLILISLNYNHFEVTVMKML